MSCPPDDSNLADQWILRRKVATVPTVRPRPTLPPPRHSVSKRAFTKSSSSTSDNHIAIPPMRTSFNAEDPPIRATNNHQRHVKDTPPSPQTSIERQILSEAPDPCSLSARSSAGHQTVSPRSFRLLALFATIACLVTWLCITWHNHQSHGFAATHRRLDSFLDTLEMASSTIADCCPVSQDTSVMHHALNNAIILGRDARHAVDAAVNQLGKTFYPRNTFGGMSCQEASRLSVRLEAAAKRASDVTDYHARTLLYCESVTSEVQQALKRVDKDRMNLYASRKQKHVGLRQQVSELLGGVTDASFDTTLSSYDAQAATLKKLEEIQSNALFASKGFKEEQAIWQSVASTLSELSHGLLEKTHAGAEGDLCVSRDHCEGLVHRLDVVAKRATS